MSAMFFTIGLMTVAAIFYTVGFAIGKHERGPSKEEKRTVYWRDRAAYWRGRYYTLLYHMTLVNKAAARHKRNKAAAYVRGRREGIREGMQRTAGTPALSIPPPTAAPVADQSQHGQSADADDSKDTELHRRRSLEVPAAGCGLPLGM